MSIEEIRLIEESFLSMHKNWLEYNGYIYCSENCKNKDTGIKYKQGD